MELPWVPEEERAADTIDRPFLKATGVIALQEPGTRPTLHGYEEYHTSQDDKWKVATLVDRNITTIQHKPIDDVDILHVLLEIIYKGNQKQSASSSTFIAPQPKAGKHRKTLWGHPPPC